MAPPHVGHNLWTDDAQPPGMRRQHLRMMRSPGMATMSCEMMGGVDTMMGTGPAAES